MIKRIAVSVVQWVYLEYRCRKCRVLYRLRGLGLYKGTIDFVVKAKPIRFDMRGGQNGGIQ